MSEKQSTSVMRNIRPLLQMILETVLPLGLFAAKLYALNADILKLGDYILPMLCGSLVIVGGLCLLIRLLLRRDHVPFFMVLYGILSAFFLVDAVYSGYTGKLPSAVMLQYTGQLGGVKEAIYENVTFARLLYAIDIPLWIVYFTHFRRKWFGGDGGSTWKLPKTAVLSALTAVCLVIGIGFCAFTPFEFANYKNEIIVYHVTDFASLLLPQNLTVPDIPVYSEQDSGTDGLPDDRYTALAAGRNVITIQAEALQNFVIGLEYNGQVVTPNLNALVGADTLYFDNYYYHRSHTERARRRSKRLPAALLSRWRSMESP